MGRYVERAENLARLLMVTESFADAGDADAAWNVILEVFADTAAFDQTGKTKTASNIAAWFLTDPETISSVLSCLAATKDNARSLRHLLSTECWVQVSRVHRELAARGGRRVPMSKLAQLCADIRTGCHAVNGVMEATCYRDEVWLFNRIGVALERADQMTRLVDMKYLQIDAADTEDEAPAAPDVVWWNTLLRSASGYHAFRRRHSFNPSAAEAAEFCLFDADFPRSVAAALRDGFACLEELEQDYAAPPDSDVRGAREALEARIVRPEKALIGKALHDFIDDAQAEISAFSTGLAARYFSA